MSTKRMTSRIKDFISAYGNLGQIAPLYIPRVVKVQRPKSIRDALLMDGLKIRTDLRKAKQAADERIRRQGQG